jgi:hypothetical protein
MAGRFGLAGKFGLAGRFGSLGREIWLSGREIWLSPVIQATWEASAVGWLEVNTPLQDIGLTSGSALMASATASGPDVALKPV